MDAMSAPKNVVIGAVGSFAVFDGEWKYVSGRTRGGDEMRALFRIRQDPSEKEDALAAYPDVASGWRRLWSEEGV